jgi:hypothetical protein
MKSVVMVFAWARKSIKQDTATTETSGILMAVRATVKSSADLHVRLLLLDLGMIFVSRSAGMATWLVWKSVTTGMRLISTVAAPVATLKTDGHVQMWHVTHLFAKKSAGTDFGWARKSIKQDTATTETIRIMMVAHEYAM